MNERRAPAQALSPGVDPQGVGEGGGKILVVKLSSLGDVVHAMPAVQDMRRAFPNAEIDWVVERAFAPLVTRCEGVQKVIPCELRKWRKAPFAQKTRAEWRVFKQRLQAQRYDAVFMACHSDQALQLLADATPAEREVLSAIPYQRNEAVLHTDTRLMPRRRLAWACWNYHSLPDNAGPLALTYNMNMLQNIDAPETLLVTLNRSDAIDPSRVILRTAYHHPVFTPGSVAAQARHREVNGVQGTYFCGAWWRNGFHEDGVASALTAVEHFTHDHAQRAVHRTA